jgi:hypothetical protein
VQHWFVYYKLDRVTARELEPRVRTMQQDIGATTGVRTRLMRRADGDDATTLLEVYEQVDDPAGFDHALAKAVARADLPAQLVAQRRCERFEEL